MRLADPRPPYCACCYQAPTVDQRKVYVDYEAAYDGPVIPGASEPVVIDDMILCEDCVKAAARLVGYEPGADLRGEISEKNKKILELEQEIRAKDKAIVHLNDTIDGVIDFPIKRPGGKSRITGPDNRKDELAQVRKSRTRSQRAKKASKAKAT